MITVTWDEVKKKFDSIEDIIASGESVKIVGEGVFDAVYMIIRPEQYMRARVEGICSQIDTSRGYGEVPGEKRDYTKRDPINPNSNPVLSEPDGVTLVAADSK
jgi:hypothetical protein